MTPEDATMTKVINHIIAAALLPLFAAGASSCGKGKASLPEDNWDPAVHEAITRMISDFGKNSPSYDSSCKPYAVFDYDNTTVMNDIALTTMIHQIETMDFSFTEENIFEALTFPIPDIDRPLEYGDTSINFTSRQLATDIEKDYAFIMKNFFKGREVPDLEGMHQSEEYLDFRAKLWGLSLGVDNTFESATGCVWIATLFDGMDEEEVKNVVRRNLDTATAEKSLFSERWTSPDGKMTVSVTKGLALPKESVNLYNTLRENGFDVYICSASLESVVEAMACDAQWGLGMEPGNVFGIRLSPTPDGKVKAVGDPSYDQTYREGKTECIRKLIAPLHGGRGPALVAGDSNGDFSMLTSFPEDLKVGLIIDVPRTGDIQKLKEKASAMRGAVLDGSAQYPLFVVQGRDDASLRYIKSDRSKTQQ